MMWAPVKKAAKVALGSLLAAQVATVGGLLLIDRRRKNERQHVPFPHSTPEPLAAGEDEVEVYTRGRDLYEQMLADMEAAEHTIMFETYLWKSDRVGRRFKQALTDAAARGVQVYVAYDVTGNLVVKPSFYRFDQRIHVLRHFPWSGMRSLRRAPGLNHRKLLIVDGDVAYIGGYNVGSLYATRWRDTHMRIKGPAAAEIENAFVDYWNQSRDEQLPALDSPGQRPWDSVIKVTRNVPSVGVYPIRYMYMENVDRARDHIYLTHAYFIPDDDLLHALTEAADRGVDVRLIVPEESNHIVADWLSRGFYRPLLARGVRLFLYQGAMVHAKTATIDGRWSTIGTANLDRLSLSGNYEINVEVLDADLAAHMEEVFAMDQSNCRELTLEEWVGRGWVNKISEAVLVPLRPLL